MALSAELVLLAGGSVQEIWNRLAATEFNQDISGIANRAGVWSYFQNLKSFADLPPIGNGFSYPYEEIQSYPHSLYLWILWSGGILAVLLFAILAALTFGNVFSRLRNFRVDASASIVMLGYVFIDQAKVEVARFESTSWVFWLTLALTFASFKKRPNNFDQGDTQE